MNEEFMELILEGEKLYNLKLDDPRNERWQNWFFACRSLIIDYFGPKSQELREFALAVGSLKKIQLLKTMATMIND